MVGEDAHGVQDVQIQTLIVVLLYVMVSLFSYDLPLVRKRYFKES